MGDAPPLAPAATKKPRAAEFFTPSELCVKLRVGRATLRAMLKAGRFPNAHRNGERGHIRVPVSDYEALFRACPEPKRRGTDPA
jgi:hypothetical protein